MKPSKALRSALNIKFIIGKSWYVATIEKWRPLDVGHMFPQVFNTLVTMGATFNALVTMGATFNALVTMGATFNP